MSSEDQKNKRNRSYAFEDFDAEDFCETIKQSFDKIFAEGKKVLEKAEGLQCEREAIQYELNENLALLVNQEAEPEFAALISCSVDEEEGVDEKLLMLESKVFQEHEELAQKLSGHSPSFLKNNQEVGKAKTILLRVMLSLDQKKNPYLLDFPGCFLNAWNQQANKIDKVIEEMQEMVANYSRLNRAQYDTMMVYKGNNSSKMDHDGGSEQNNNNRRRRSSVT